MRRSLALAAVPGCLLVASPASASCAEVGQAAIARQPVVFVGSALEERRGHARFEVESVVVGPDLAPEVWVQSGPYPPPWWSVGATGTSVDASFVPGASYVVGADRSFGTNTCIVAPVDATDDVRRVDPAALGTARPPTAGGLEGVDPPASPVTRTLVATGGLGAVVAAGVLLVRRRR